MAKEKINILSLPTQGTASLTERSGQCRLQAEDAVSALQAVARQTHIEILLNKQEVDRLVKAGKLRIDFHFSNDMAGAADAARRIDLLAAEAAPADGRITLGKLLLWLLLALAAGSVGFVAVVFVLDAVQGTHTLAGLFS
jgi:hypothetical protein